MQESFRISSAFHEEVTRICKNSQNFRLFRYALVDYCRTKKEKNLCIHVETEVFACKIVK